MAGVVEREALLELLSFGLAETLALPLPAPPVRLLCAARDSGPGVVLSEWVGGALEEEELEEGVPRGTLLPPGRPCRPWPHTWWCFSQSLCWQNEPQYRAVLQPLQVSLAFLPQFQQLSLESSCWLMTVSASSDACLLASASALSILERSAEIIS